MSNADWAAFAARLRAGGIPMPAIVERARGDRRRMIVGMVGIWVLATAQIAAAASWLLPPRRPLDVVAGSVVASVACATLIAAHVAARGHFAEGPDTPAGVLTALEGRHRARRRLLRWIPWLVAFAILGTAAVTAASMVAARRWSGLAAVTTLLASAATIGFAWLVIRRVTHKIDHDLREIEDCRRLLASEG